jgi:magnesium chelatase family protein
MAKTYSCVLVGVEARLIEIETVLGSGFSGLNILGLPTDITRDMRERVRSALESIGIPIPARRVVVNIGPTEHIKLSRTPLAQLDFSVAASILHALFQEQEQK